MAVLVKGIEMPKSCGECIFHRPLYHTLYCIILNKNCAPHTTIKDFCPLAYIPEPHGRLIDADALCASHKEVCSRSMKFNLDLAQTVIPASEDEIDEAQRDYQAAADYQQYCETYEQTYDPDTGAM